MQSIPSLKKYHHFKINKILLLILILKKLYELSFFIFKILCFILSIYFYFFLNQVKV